MADNKLTCKIVGEVTVHLQYGSDYDIKNDDGYETCTSFPFIGTFSCILTESGIENYKIESSDIEIDTDSFYE